MGVIAVYCRNGGAGKTTLAVNLAWASARLSKHSTLLWDLDPQGNATFVMSSESVPGSRFGAALAFQVGMEQFVQQTSTPKLALLPADTSLRTVDMLAAGGGRGKRIDMILQQARRTYSRIIVDCPPGFSALNDEALMAADIILVPVTPSAVSMRAFVDLMKDLKSTSSLLMPVFTMVDRKRASHQKFLLQHLDFPVVPVSESVEMMSDRRAALGVIAPRSDVARAFALLWKAIEARLAGLSGSLPAEPAPMAIVQKVMDR